MNLAESFKRQHSLNNYIISVKNYVNHLVLSSMSLSLYYVEIRCSIDK
jgi:hypothetical protein